MLAAAKAELKAEFDLYNPLSYSTENYEKLTKIYTDALAAMDKAFSEEDEEGALPPIFESAKENFLKVETLALNNVYKIASENEKVLVDGVIDYREGGIEPYVATSSKISGTVTGDKPFTFQLVAKDGDEIVDPSSLT